MTRFRALPYAKALHGVIRSQHPGREEAVIGELERVAEALESVPEFQRVLTTPGVSAETKTAILDEVLDALEITEPTRRFIHVVQGHYRTEHMGDIAAVYRDLVDRALGRTRARVEVAAGLSDREQQEILSGMSEVLGAVVVASFEDKPELLAGFRVQVGSRIFDGSLVGEVDRLSRETTME
jgi:F-type H+-transporting ATPase subunit delta